MVPHDGLNRGELMADGTSLGDVLGMLQEHVGGNSEEFANLWGNVRASKGALAIANAGAAEFNAELAARKAGLKLGYSASIRMVDNYLPGFEMQNQIETAGEKKIEEQIEQVCREIAERRENTVKLTSAKRAEMALVHNTMGRAILKSSAAQDYIVSDDCIRCGICAKVCPANNIIVTDRVRFSDYCEVCYACVHNCPKNAIHLKNERSAARFRNEHVELKDILSANE